MLGNEYQHAVLRTASHTNTDDLFAWIAKMEARGYDDPAAILMAKDGLAGEAGEVVDFLKKSVFHGHPWHEGRECEPGEKDSRATLLKEVGDIMWYCARLAAALHEPLGNVMEANIAKLKNRYADGFSSEASINRKD